jgi:hypothetical protein
MLHTYLWSSLRSFHILWPCSLPFHCKSSLYTLFNTAYFRSLTVALLIRTMAQICRRYLLWEETRTLRPDHRHPRAVVQLRRPCPPWSQNTENSRLADTDRHHRCPRLSWHLWTCVRGHPSISLLPLSSPTLHLFICLHPPSPLYYLQGPCLRPTTSRPDSPTTFQKSTHQ